MFKSLGLCSNFCYVIWHLCIKNLFAKNIMIMFLTMFPWPSILVKKQRTSFKSWLRFNREHNQGKKEKSCYGLLNLEKIPIVAVVLKCLGRLNMLRNILRRKGRNIMNVLSSFRSTLTLFCSIAESLTSDALFWSLPLLSYRSTSIPLDTSEPQVTNSQLKTVQTNTSI